MTTERNAQGVLAVMDELLGCDGDLWNVSLGNRRAALDEARAAVAELAEATRDVFRHKGVGGATYSAVPDSVLRRPLAALARVQGGGV